MCAKRIAVLCSTDPRQDNRIQKQVQVLLDLNYTVTLFGVDTGTDIPSDNLKGASVHLYPKDIFPSWARRIIQTLRNLRGHPGSKEGSVNTFAPQLAKDDLERLSLSRAVKAIGVDMRYLSFIYDAVRKDVAYFKPDVIHAHELPAAAAGLRIAKALNCKFIYDAHEFETDRQGLLPRFSWALRKHIEGKVMRQTDGNITVSDIMSEAHVNNYDIEPPTLIYNAPVVNLSVSNPANCFHVKKALNLKNSEKLAVYVGGFRPGRGLDIILEATGMISDLHLACVGISPNSFAAKQVMKEAHAQKLGSNLHFVAPRQPSELISFLSSADVSLIATENTCLNHTYSMPNKLFESAFGQVPLVVTPIAATANFVRDLSVGEVAKSYAPSDYATAIRQVLHKSREGYYPDKVTQSLEIEYSWSAQADKLAKMYHRLLG